MVIQTFSSYVTALCAALISQQGDQLADILDLTKKAAKNAASQRQRYHNNADLQSLRRLNQLPELQEFADCHCCSLGLAPDEAFQQQVKASRAFRQAFSDDDSGAWLVRPLMKVASNLFVAAAAADAVQQEPDAAQSPLETCGGELVSLFAAAKKRSEDTAKRMGALTIAITLFKIYVALNTPQLGRNLILAIQSPSFPPFNTFPASQRVTYRYYLGRMAILDDKLDDAAGHLEYAFQHCLDRARVNKRRILYYLVPVNMVYMRLPSARLLQQYDLHIYQDIAEAMRTGNVAQLNAALQQHQWTFIQMGTYLVMEKLRHAVYRRLFRRVHALHAETCEPGRGHQLPLRSFHSALTWLQDDWYQDYDECECLVANLICQNYIKGYISHGQGMVVLSKQNPYPGIDQMTLADPL